MYRYKFAYRHKQQEADQFFADLTGFPLESSQPLKVENGSRSLRVARDVRYSATPEHEAAEVARFFHELTGPILTGRQRNARMAFPHGEELPMGIGNELLSRETAMQSQARTRLGDGRDYTSFSTFPLGRTPSLRYTQLPLTPTANEGETTFSRALTDSNESEEPAYLTGQAENDPEQISSSGLTWSGATEAQVEFMKQVYDVQVRNASRIRTFVGNVPASELEVVEGGSKMRRPAGGSCRFLLAAAREELGRQKSNGAKAALAVSSISVGNAYRSASRQFRNWQGAFPKYYDETLKIRSSKAGGAHGPAAVGYLAEYIGARLAAPGYSLHNNGLAVDFGTTDSGQVLGPDTSRPSLEAWRRSWLWNWLSSNAAAHQFFQNTSIDEPWHWEYRVPSPQQETAVVTAGREELSNITLLRTHRGTPPDLVLKWNDMEVTPDVVDVVVHLHGHSPEGSAMRLVRDMEPICGLDFFDPDRPYVSLGRRRPTLCILPRGDYAGGDKYRFPALKTPTGMKSLIEIGTSHFGRGIGVTELRRGRLIITAHSGGGEALEQVLQYVDPDEIHVFDALYWPVGNLIRWMQRHIRRDMMELDAPISRDPSALMANRGGALRVFYRPGGIPGRNTEDNSREVYRAIRAELASASPAKVFAAGWYRVEKTVVAHSQIPRRFGWQLLNGANSDILGAGQP